MMGVGNLHFARHSLDSTSKTQTVLSVEADVMVRPDLEKLMEN